jgi:nitrogenase subunit NifH
MNKKIIIVTGHYGSGKTNISVNFALQYAKQGEKTALVDFDIVNPYFRATDNKKILEENGIRVITPVFANTNLENPSLPPEIASVFVSDESVVILDVGGDDAGAVVLGGYAGKISALDYEMFYVISKYRPLTSNAKDTAELLKEIEKVSKLKATALINNSSIGEQTTSEIVLNSIEYANEVAKQTGLPIQYTTVISTLKNELDSIKNLFPINIYTKAIW